MDSENFFVAARVLHVIGVVLWIGGVAFITTVLLPTLRSMPEAEKSMVLFVIEPFFLSRKLHDKARRNPGNTFRLIHRMLWILSILSLIAILGAVAGVHS